MKRGCSRFSPSLQLLRQFSPSLQLLRQFSPSLQLLRQFSPSLQLLRQFSPSLQLLRQFSPSLQLLRQFSPSLQLLRQFSPSLQLLRQFSPSLQLLRQFHRLPVTYRINFKLSTLTYHALPTQQPPYLASLLHLSNIARQLRSSISQPVVPKTKLNLGKRAFSTVAASMVWNELPMKTSETIATFGKKTQYLFIPNCISTT